MRNFRDLIALCNETRRARWVAQKSRLLDHGNSVLINSIIEEYENAMRYLAGRGFQRITPRSVDRKVGIGSVEKFLPG